MKRHRRRLTWAVLATASASLLLWSSCGGNNDFNLFQALTKSYALKHDPKARLEAARIMLDERQYSDAVTLLASITSDSSQDSNQARLYYASAIIGAAGLDIWSIVSNIVTTISSGSSSLSLDAIFNLIGTDILGTGSVQTARIQALLNAVKVLQAAPNPSDTTLTNTNCLFAAFIAVPTISNGTAAIKALLTVLSELSSAGSTSGSSCPNTSGLSSAISLVTTTANELNVVLQLAKSCTFLNLSAAAATSNNVTTALNTFVSAADKGCSSVPTCPSSLPNCQSLFPTCVQETLQVGSSTAKAGDGVIAPCEIILNCLDPSSCFSGFSS